MESQIIGLVLIVLGVVRAWGDFNPASLMTWVFVIGMTLLLAVTAALYIVMESRRRNASA